MRTKKQGTCTTELDFAAASFRSAPWTWPSLTLSRAATKTKPMFQNSRGRKSPRQKVSYIAQNSKKHRVRKLAGKCILLARMVRRKQTRQIPRQFVTRAMPKRKRSQRRNLPALFQRSQISPHRDAAQHQHSARLQNFQVALPEVAAFRKLRRQRLVRRRRAAQSRSHISIPQREAVVAIRRSGLIGKTRAKQRLVKKIAGAVSSEYSPGAVAAMRGGRKPQNQELGTRIAEARNRLAPIIPRKERPPLVPCDLFAIPYESRARAAVNNFLIELFQFSQGAVPLQSYHEPSPARQASKECVAKLWARRLRRHASRTLVVCRMSVRSNAQKSSESTDLDG